MTTILDEYTYPDMLVESDWLAAHRTDPNVRIIDAGSKDAYRRAHIPGAVGYPGSPYLKDDAFFIIGPEAFSVLMQTLGVNNDTLVIAYDGSSGLFASRLWWALQYYGHTQVRLLNGGWDAWVAEERPIAVQPTAPERGTFQSQVQEDWLARLDYVKESIGHPERLLLDVRSDSEWTGENPVGTKHGGHMPGAVHLEWNKTVDSTTKKFKPAAELRAMFADAGLTPDHEVVAY